MKHFWTILFLIMYSHLNLNAQTTQDFPIGKWSVIKVESGLLDRSYVNILNCLKIEINEDFSINVLLPSNSEINDQNIQKLLIELNNGHWTKYYIGEFWVYLILNESNKQFGSIFKVSSDESILEFNYNAPKIFGECKIGMRK